MGTLSKSDAGDEDVQINFLASSAQKDRWQEYADEAGFRSLSEFFRVVAERELNQNESNEPTGDVGAGDQTPEVMESLNRIESHLHDLDNRIATVEREVREDPEIKKLANEVFGILPTREEIIELEVKEVSSDVLPPDVSPSNAGTVEAIAASLEEEEYRVASALDKLRQETHQVHTMVPAEDVRDGKQHFEDPRETRYYKSE